MNTTPLQVASQPGALDRASQEAEPLWHRAFRLVQPQQGEHTPPCPLTLHGPVCLKIMEDHCLDWLWLAYEDMLRQYLHIYTGKTRPLMREFLQDLSEQTILPAHRAIPHTFTYTLNIEEWLLEHHHGGCKVQHHVRRALAQAVQANILKITRWENHESTVEVCWNANWTEWRLMLNPLYDRRNPAKIAKDLAFWERRLAEQCDLREHLLAYVQSLSRQDYEQVRQDWIRRERHVVRAQKKWETQEQAKKRTEKQITNPGQK